MALKYEIVSIYSKKKLEAEKKGVRLKKNTLKEIITRTKKKRGLTGVDVDINTIRTRYKRQKIG